MNRDFRKNVGGGPCTQRRAGEGQGDVVRIEVIPARRRPSLRRPLAFALPIAALIAIYFFWPGRGEIAYEEPPAVRIDGPRPEGRLVPHGELMEAPSRFEWLPVPGASGYRFELYGANSELLYQAVTPNTALQLGDTAPLFEQRRFGYWQVVPIGQTGTDMSAFPPQHFQILGGP